MTYHRDLVSENCPETDLFRGVCDSCGQMMEYEDYQGTPMRKMCSLCAFKESHSIKELMELKKIMAQLRKIRRTDYLLVEDAIYIFECAKESQEGIE
jgi:hypothetical protein